jgi:hypothetical protein
MAPRRRLRYAVMPDGAGYAITEEGDPLAVAANPEAVRDIIHPRSQRRAFELASLMGWVRVRGTLVDAGGARILLVGPSGVSRTTLALRLLLDGAAVQGDDSVLLRGGSALAVPRPFMVEARTRDALPELADALALLPRIGDAAVLDPTRDLGMTWRLRVLPLDHVVVLDDSPGPVTCLPASRAEVLGDLTGNLLPASETKPVMLRALTTSLAPATCHRMRVGDVREMQRALSEATC